MKRRRGFSLVEMITCTVLLAIIMIAVVRSSMAIDTLRVQTRDTVYLSLQNLNTMERLRQQCLENPQGMLLFYSDQQLGTVDIETEAFLTVSTWDHFHIYQVRIESCVRETKQRLVSSYYITDIGAYEQRNSL